MEKSTKIKPEMEYPCYCCECNGANEMEFPCILCDRNCWWDHLDLRVNDYFMPIIVLDTPDTLKEIADLKAQLEFERSTR